MPLHVQVLHPSYARFVPRGGRVQRDGFFPLRTPVEIEHASPGEFEYVGVLHRDQDPPYNERYGPSRRPIHVGRGGLWTPLFQGERTLPVEGLVRFLEGDVHPAGEHGDPQGFFHRTPVLARWNGYQGSRGEGDLHRSREVIHDGSRRAVADLLRFFEEDVVILDGQAMVRIRGAMASYRAGRGNEPGSLAMGWLGNGHYDFSRVADLEDTAYLAEKLARNEPYCTERGLFLPVEEGLENYYGLECVRPFPFELTRGATLRCFANDAHGRALGLSVVMEAIEGAAREGTMPREVGEAVARSRHWRALGAVGSVRDDEIAECLMDLRTVMRELRDAFPRPANSHGLRRLSRDLERDILPRLGLAAAAAEESPEDEDALGGLGMAP